MNCLAIDAFEKLIANRKEWGLQRLHSLNQLLLSSYNFFLLLSCHDCKEEKCFPEEDVHKFWHLFYKGISKSEIPRQVGPSTHYLSSTIVYLSIYQKNYCLSQMPQTKANASRWDFLTKQYQKNCRRP